MAAPGALATSFKAACGRLSAPAPARPALAHSVRIGGPARQRSITSSAILRTCRAGVLTVVFWHNSSGGEARA